MTSYSMTFSVSRVENRRRAVSARKLPNGETEVEYEDTGWWLTLWPGPVSYFIGYEKPEITDKDEVKMTLEVISRAES